MTTTATKFSKSASEFLSAFDGAIDSYVTTGVKFDTQKLLDQFKLKSNDVKAIQTKVAKTTDELELVVIEADEQLMEGYSNFSKAQLREMLDAYHTIMQQATKVTRAPRTPKEKKEKVVVEKVTLNYDAVFTVCTKYVAVRSFIGNVKVTGKNVEADEVAEYKFPGTSLQDLMNLQSYTKDQMIEFIKNGRKASRTSTSLSGTTIDFILKF